MSLTMYDTKTTTRVRVLVGEDDDPGRRGDKKLIARSVCTYYCPDEVTARRCIDSLHESDERLRNRPEEQMLWEWQSTWWEAEEGNENGGGTVHLGVAWYDQDFYEDRKTAWFGARHKHIYKRIGIRSRTSASPTGPSKRADPVLIQPGLHQGPPGALHARRALRRSRGFGFTAFRPGGQVSPAECLGLRPAAPLVHRCP